MASRGLPQPSRVQLERAPSTEASSVISPVGAPIQQELFARKVRRAKNEHRMV